MNQPLSAEQVLEIGKIVDLEMERRWAKVVADAEEALTRKVKESLDRLENVEAKFPPQIITKHGTEDFLGAPLAKLVDDHVAARFTDNKNLIGQWIDERWDKKRERLKGWLGWGSLAGLLALIGGLSGFVQNVVKTEVKELPPQNQWLRMVEGILSLPATK